MKVDWVTLKEFKALNYTGHCWLWHDDWPLVARYKDGKFWLDGQPAGPGTGSTHVAIMPEPEPPE